MVFPNLEIYRGDNKTFTVSFTNNSVPLDITGYTIFFTVKNQNVVDTSILDTTDALIKKDITSHTDPTGGITEIELVPADTFSLSPGTYSYDIQWKSSAGEIKTIIKGEFNVVSDVTRRVV